MEESKKYGSLQGKEVVVLYGGWSEERTVSLASGKKVAASLARQKIPYRLVDPDRTLSKFIQQLESPKRPDIIFNALHGLWGEDGRMQSVLDILEIPQTHSSSFASAICMNKIYTSHIAQNLGITVAKFRVSTWQEASQTHVLPAPYVIKPINEGSSVGVHIVQVGEDPIGPKMADWHFSKKVMVEEYIPGKEVTCGIMNNKALPLIELRPVTGFYDYYHKYTQGVTDHIIPAEIPKTIEQKCQRWTEKLHKAIGCKGVTRSDYRYDIEQDRLVLLEINTQPGLTDLSLVPEAANHSNISYDELIYWLLEDALCPDPLN